MLADLQKKKKEKRKKKRVTTFGFAALVTFKPRIR
jgi:hypothetical protein